MLVVLAMVRSAGARDRDIRPTRRHGGVQGLGSICSQRFHVQSPCPAQPYRSPTPGLRKFHTK